MMKINAKFIAAILILATGVGLASCSSMQSRVINANEMALSSHQESYYKQHAYQADIDVGPDSVVSQDGDVVYYIDCETEASPDKYPVVEVSPHELTPQDAQRIGQALFGEAQFLEYEYNRSPSAAEREANMERWETYLSDGTIQDLVNGNELLIKDYELVLSRFRANYANVLDNSSDGIEMAPCEWEFHPDSFYFGELAESEHRAIRARVNCGGATYRFDIVNRTADDFCVYMISAYLYDDLSPNNIDTLIREYELCKSPEPSQEQIDEVVKKVYAILDAFQIGDWIVDCCQVDSLCRGSQEAYIITVKACPAFAGVPVIRQVQLSNLRSDLACSQHLYYSDAEFRFAANGHLLTCAIRSPLDVNQLSEDCAEALSCEKLLQIAKEHLKSQDVSVFRDYYTDDPNEDVSAKVYITSMDVGLVRIEVENGMTYRYIPALCLDGYFEIYNRNGDLLMDSSELGLCRMLEINAIDGTEIAFSSDGSFTFLEGN